ncbi:MAG: preprotein translocase subunit SecE [Chloroflexota bacterium]
MAKKREATQPKKEYRIVRYFREVKAELHKVTWPTRQAATRLTLIVLGVTAAMSLTLGFVDWMFSRLFGLLLG